MASIKVNKDSCTGCTVCELVCSAVKNEEINPKRSRIRVEETYPLPSSPTVCRQCKNPLCKEACAEGAIEVVDDLIIINYDKCTKCLECIEACPFKAMFVDVKNGFPVKCDLCNGNPQCVEYCPRGALTF